MLRRPLLLVALLLLAACERSETAGEPAKPPGQASSGKALASASAALPVGSAAQSAAATGSVVASAPSIDELLGLPNPFDGSPPADVPFGKPLWADAPGTMQQLELRMPAAWKHEPGGYEGMNTAWAPDEMAMVSTMFVYPAMVDPAKAPAGLKSELLRWYKFVVQATLTPHQQIRVGRGRIEGLLQAGEGTMRLSRPGCMAPNAPESCREKVRVWLFLPRDPAGKLVTALLRQSASDACKRELWAAMTSLQVVNAAAAPDKGVFPNVKVF